MGEILIRRATPDDVPVIGELWKEMMDFHSGHDAFFTRAEDGHTKFADYMQTHMDRDGSLILVAEADGAVVGYCFAAVAQYPPVFTRREYVIINDLAVTQARRRAGVGQGLIAEVRRWCARCEIDRIEVRVATCNEVSNAFYRKAGFEPYLHTMFLENP